MPGALGDPRNKKKHKAQLVSLGNVPRNTRPKSETLRFAHTIAEFLQLSPSVYWTKSYADNPTFSQICLSYSFDQLC